MVSNQQNWTRNSWHPVRFCIFKYNAMKSNGLWFEMFNGKWNVMAHLFTERMETGCNGLFEKRRHPSLIEVFEKKDIELMCIII